jgi:Zn-dependent peptidase ImmA (M78 family)/DNA-binding XRE family transcriptional regulator
LEKGFAIAFLQKKKTKPLRMKNFSERLKSARIMKGYSLQDLTDALNNAVSKQALNKYEQGLMKPESDVLIKICNALDVRPDYFTRETSINLENVEFRKLRKLSAKESARIKEKTVDILERYFELEDILGIDEQFVNPIVDLEINSYQDVEKAADRLKELWKLGEDPLPNVIELLEDHNIKVVEIEAGDEFVGLATWKGIKNPVIVVNSSLKADRKRFTVLHELGHILMKVNHQEEKDREFLCHSFAGAMLIPRESLIKELGPSRSQIYLNELVYLKEQFGVSIQAIMFRAKHLGIISESFHKNFMIYLSMKGYKKNEPGDYKGSEKSNRFKQLLFRAVAEEIISTSKAAALDNKKLSEFREDLDFYEK